LPWNLPRPAAGGDDPQHAYSDIAFVDLNPGRIHGYRLIMDVAAVIEFPVDARRGGGTPTALPGTGDRLCGV